MKDTLRKGRSMDRYDDAIADRRVAIEMTHLTENRFVEAAESAVTNEQADRLYAWADELKDWRKQMEDWR